MSKPQMTGAEIAKITAISHNLEKKRDKSGALPLIVNTLAEKLANKDIRLSADQETELFDILDRIESGTGQPKHQQIKSVGSVGGKRKEGTGCISWHKNKVHLWGLGLSIDFRNKRIFDHQGSQILDFQRKVIRNFSDDDIEEFLKIAQNESD